MIFIKFPKSNKNFSQFNYMKVKPLSNFGYSEGT